MADDVLIRVENVGKKYCRSLKRSMFYGLQDIARDTIGFNPSSDTLRKDEFWVVNDVSFEVKRGECLGIIGPNGAGKSTLLKMLNGIILPDKGKIAVRGRVGALIEVGAGFHPMLTGRENVYLNGSILGLTKKEIDRKFDEIVAFAELDDFIDMPVKHYSSGMYVRLGFAIAAHADSDLLIIDEVLAVGDTNFRAKCLNVSKQFLSSGGAILLVSHNMLDIHRICTSTFLLNHGRAIKANSVSECIIEYLSLNARNKSYESSALEENQAPQPKISITRNPAQTGSPLSIKIHLCISDQFSDMWVGYSLTASCGTLILADTVHINNPSIGEACIEISWDQLFLSQGAYWIGLFAWGNDRTILIYKNSFSCQLKVIDPTLDTLRRDGLICFPPNHIKTTLIPHGSKST